MLVSTRVSKSRHSPTLPRALPNDLRRLVAGLRSRQNQLCRPQRGPCRPPVQSSPIQLKATRMRLLVASSREGNRGAQSGPRSTAPLTTPLANIAAQPALSQFCRFSMLTIGQPYSRGRFPSCRRLRHPRFKDFLERLSRNGQNHPSNCSERIFLTVRRSRQSDLRVARRSPSAVTIREIKLALITQP
jgi:hypothetical protein